MEHELGVLDEAILKTLPSGCKVVSVVPHGETRWSTGWKVTVRLPPPNNDDDDEGESGSIVSGGRVGLDKTQVFFLKIISREEWIPMAEAEYEAQTTLSKHIPANTVVPMAWGMISDDPQRSFYLTKFRSLRPITSSTTCSDGSPASSLATKLLAVLKTLHQTSSSSSPTVAGGFGFPVRTFFGPTPMINIWTESWEEFFARQFRADVAHILAHHHGAAAAAELASLAGEFADKVIPRLLRPLQTGGRVLEPVLCHGDLWDGNVAIDDDGAGTGELVLFDAMGLWGHNEFDLQCMSDSPGYILGTDFIELYRAEVGASEPQEDFWDRHRLYRIRVELVNSIVYPDRAAGCVQMCKDEMGALLEKYPAGYADFRDGKERGG